MKASREWRRAWLLPVVPLLILGTANVNARRPPGTDTLRLSLDEAVSRVLSESEEIAAARAQIAQAESQVTQALATALPQLSTNLTEADKLYSLGQ